MRSPRQLRADCHPSIRDFFTARVLALERRMLGTPASHPCIRKGGACWGPRLPTPAYAKAAHAGDPGFAPYQEAIGAVQYIAGERPGEREDERFTGDRRPRVSFAADCGHGKIPHLRRDAPGA